MNDLVKDKRLRMFLAILAAGSGVVALVTFYQSRKTRKLREEVMALDKEIKELELLQKKKQLS